MNKWGKKFWVDLAERTGATFVAAFIPAYVAVSNVTQLDWVNALEISGTAAGLTLLKGLGKNLSGGDEPSASLVGVSSATVKDLDTGIDPGPLEDPGVEDHED